MDKEKIMLNLLKAKYPYESALVGNYIMQELIRDYYEEVPDAIKFYKQSEDGFNFELFETLALIFASIPALESLLNVIERFAKNKNECDLKIKIYNKLVEHGFDTEKAEQCSNEIIKGE